jgi:hypothetical protein
MLEVTNLNDGSLIKAEMNYLFSLYSAAFQLLKADSYSSVIQLTQKGGLKAFYFESVDFEELSLIRDLNMHSHLPNWFS